MAAQPSQVEEQLPPRKRRTAALIALGLIVAGILSVLAPTDWEEGEGTSILAYLDSAITEFPVEVGSAEAVSHGASANGLDFVVEYPSGIPVDSTVEATIAVTRNGAPVQIELSAISLTLRLPDGADELVPIVRWDETDEQLVAVRRPPTDARVMLGLLGLVVVLWVTEALPLFVTSLLIPVVLVFSGIAAAPDATSPFFNPIIVLFFAGFLMAEAMKRTGLDHYAAVGITAVAGRSARTLFATMILLTAVLSMFMSNTAAAVVLIPIAVAVTADLDNVAYTKALVIGIAYAATIGGVGSAIGTPANQLAIEFLDGFAGREISFVEWFAFGLPMVLLFLPVMGIYLWRRSRINVDAERFAVARKRAVEERAKLGRPTREQLVVLGVLLAVTFGWVTQTAHGVHAGIVALAGAIALFVLGSLKPEDVGQISWPALITFGGGLTLGLFLVKTGTSDYLATRLGALSGAPSIVAVLAVALITLLLTTVASNIASAAILIPLAIPLAGVLGVNPTELVLIVAVASAIDFALVIGTPPTMVAYATRLYTAGEIFRKGAVLDVVGIGVLVLVVARIWDQLGLI